MEVTQGAGVQPRGGAAGSGSSGPTARARRSAPRLARKRAGGGLLLAAAMALVGTPRAGWGQTGDLVVRHPWPHAHSALRRLAEEYRRSTGTRVVVTCESGEGTPGGKQAQADVIGLRACGADAGLVAALARAGRAQNLSPWLDDRWRAGFLPAGMRPFVVAPGNRWKVKPGVYGVPLSVDLRLFIYRRDLLARAEITSDPERWQWEDLLDAGRRLRAIGIEPLVGALSPACRPALCRMYEASCVGASGLCRTYHGEGRYDSEPWRALFRLYLGLKDAGICCSPLALAEREEAQGAFLAGQAAMLVDGPRFTALPAARNGSVAWKVLPPPWGGEGARFLPAVPAAVGESLIVSPHSARRTRAAGFLRWLTRTEAQVAYANALSVLPATTAAIRSQHLAPGLQRFARYADMASPDLSACEDPVVSRVYREGVIGILQGKAAPEAALARVDRVKRLRQPGPPQARAPGR